MSNQDHLLNKCQKISKTGQEKEMEKKMNKKGKKIREKLGTFSEFQVEAKNYNVSAKHQI